MTLIANSAMDTRVIGQFGINSLCIARPVMPVTLTVMPAQAGIQCVSKPAAVADLPLQNLSKPAAVADLGSDPNSAQQHQARHKRIPELGSDPNSAGHRGRSALPAFAAFAAQPARRTRRAATSYWGTRNRRPPTGPIWLDTFVPRPCKGRLLTINKIASSAYWTSARGQFGINSVTIHFNRNLTP